MKEITSTAFNFLAQLHKDGPPTPDVEVALVFSEVVYDLNQGGEIVRNRRTETVRFTAPPAILRKLAKQFTDVAEECETYLAESLREHADKEVRAVLQRQRELSGKTATPADSRPAEGASAPYPPPQDSPLSP